MEGVSLPPLFRLQKNPVAVRPDITRSPPRVAPRSPSKSPDRKSPVDGTERRHRDWWAHHGRAHLLRSATNRRERWKQMLVRYRPPSVEQFRDLLYNELEVAMNSPSFAPMSTPSQPRPRPPYMRTGLSLGLGLGLVLGQGSSRAQPMTAPPIKRQNRSVSAGVVGLATPLRSRPAGSEQARRARQRLDMPLVEMAEELSVLEEGDALCAAHQGVPGCLSLPPEGEDDDRPLFGRITRSSSELLPHTSTSWRMDDEDGLCDHSPRWAMGGDEGEGEGFVDGDDGEECDLFGQDLSPPFLAPF